MFVLQMTTMQMTIFYALAKVGPQGMVIAESRQYHLKSIREI